MCLWYLEHIFRQALVARAIAHLEVLVLHRLGHLLQPQLEKRKKGQKIEQMSRERHLDLTTRLLIFFIFDSSDFLFLDLLLLCFCDLPCHLVRLVAWADAFLVKQSNQARRLLLNEVADDLVVKVRDRRPSDALRER